MNAQNRRWGQRSALYLAAFAFCLLTISPTASPAASIVGWGHNDDGRATPPSGNHFIAIAAI